MTGFNGTKFTDPERTVSGETRASVDYKGTKTLWLNTGTLCNITCENCYIESSPSNDRLVYLQLSDVTPFLDELDAAGEQAIEIGITGGEPFMAPEILAILEAILIRGHRVLVLTNAMKPMMRPRVKGGLMALQEKYADRLVLRVSLDHYSATKHDAERGHGSFEEAVLGLRWLAENGFQVHLAGRTIWQDSLETSQQGYARLIKALGLPTDVDDPTQLVLFPEMQADDDPPEITTACWQILGKDPNELMCASQRMVVRRKGAPRATVVACTLLPYEAEFELGQTLSESRQPVALNHAFCASFCVLGGGSCSA